MTDFPQKVKDVGEAVQRGDASIATLANVIGDGLGTLETLIRTTHGLMLEEVGKLSASQTALADEIKELVAILKSKADKV